MTLSGLEPTKSSFPPVANAKTRVLILGSLPGEASLRRSQYYAHARNAFWPLMAALTERELVAKSYPDRLASLLDAGVGLWDVVRRARRTGSLDAHIRDHIPNALAELAASLPRLRAIAFNGAKAAEIGRPALAGISADLIDLPSSSPAHAVAFERKRAAWMALRPYLEP
jgi:hypoxanthine-DNA glycosylase